MYNDVYIHWHLNARGSGVSIQTGSIIPDSFQHKYPGLRTSKAKQLQESQ